MFYHGPVVPGSRGAVRPRKIVPSSFPSSSVCLAFVCVCAGFYVFMFISS